MLLGAAVDTVWYAARIIPLRLYTIQPIQGEGEERDMHGPHTPGSMKRAPGQDGRTNRKC